MNIPSLPRLFNRLATWQALLLLLALVVLFSLWLFPQRTARLRLECGGTSPVFDARFTYSAQEVYPAFARCSPAGRRFYALSEASLDLVFPVLYNLFLSLCLAAAFRRPDRPQGSRLSLLPAGSLLLDYFENGCLVAILLLYPRQIAILPAAASVITPLKWIWGSGCFLLAVVGFMVERLGIKSKGP